METSFVTTCLTITLVFVGIIGNACVNLLLLRDLISTQRVLISTQNDLAKLKKKLKALEKQTKGSE